MTRVKQLQAAAFAAWLLSCDPTSARDGASAPARGEGEATSIVATVNGVAIRDDDLDIESRGKGHTAKEGQVAREDALENIIRLELVRQKAIALHLDSDPGFRQKRRALEAELRAFERRELAEVFFRREAANKAGVTDEEAKRWFDDNLARVRKEIRVRQILRRDERVIREDLAELERGIPFEEVARKQFPTLPTPDAKPWDLGYLRWNQIPAAWQETLARLERGKPSGILRGPKGRFWIIEILDERENSSIDFEQSKPLILDVLQVEAAATLRERIDRELRSGAKIDIPQQPIDAKH